MKRILKETKIYGSFGEELAHSCESILIDDDQCEICAAAKEIGCDTTHEHTDLSELQD